MRRIWFAVLLPMVLLPLSACPALARAVPLEKQILAYIASEGFQQPQARRQCPDDGNYRVVLIDNFEHQFNLIPGVRTSHGDILARMLKSGRADIDLEILNTSLAKGLATVLDNLRRGQCADAIISSIPGSNYTYAQISSLLPDRGTLSAHNIMAHRAALRKLIRAIALDGFPSVAWLERADVNAVKLRNDARKFVFIEALGRYGVPILLPYGNSDIPYKGKAKSVNILSLAANARTFSALNQAGRRIPGFPYSPLSSGDEPAVYDIRECADPGDSSRAQLDINNDGFGDYIFRPEGSLPMAGDPPCRMRGKLRGTSLIPPNKVKELLPPKF